MKREIRETLGKGIVCLLAIGMFANTGWAVAKEATQGTETAKAIEPKLIIEYKFDEPVVDIIFDEATMTVKEARILGVKGLEKRKATEKVKVQYPKVIFTEHKASEEWAKSIKFLDKNQKLKKEIDLEKESSIFSDKKFTPSPYRIISKNKKYICVDGLEIERWGPGEYDWNWTGESEAVIFDTEGNILRRIKHPYCDIFVSPNGRYIVGVGEEGVGWGLCNEKGIVKEFQSHYVKGDFSKDGNYFVGIDREVWVAITEDGRELWRKQTIDEDLTRELELEEPKQWCVYSKDGSWRVLIQTGCLIVVDEGVPGVEDDKIWKKRIPIAYGNYEILDLKITDNDMVSVKIWNKDTDERFKYFFDKKANLIKKEPWLKEEK